MLYYLDRNLGDVDVVAIDANNLKDFIYYLRTKYRPVRPRGDVSPLSETTILAIGKLCSRDGIG